MFDGKSVLDVERALAVARSTAAEAGVAAEFVQQDLLLPPQDALQGRQFDVILDSAVYHVFGRGSKDREDYVRTLGQLLKPGGRIVMLVFSDKQPGDQGPVRITTEDIHGSYAAPAWTGPGIRGGHHKEHMMTWPGLCLAVRAQWRGWHTAARRKGGSASRMGRKSPHQQQCTSSRFPCACQPASNAAIAFASRYVQCTHFLQACKQT
ncbi:hypothetical protein ABPG75_010649 [Micractinium tetrahymenae]